MVTRKTKSNTKSKTKSNTKPKTKSVSKPKSKTTRRNSRKKPSASINNMKQQMVIFKNKMKKYITENNLSVTDLAKKISRHWSQLTTPIKKSLSSVQAKEMAKHYISMFGKRGGSLAGAPLDYAMGPGMPGATTYGVFPTEIGADVKSTQHLDVYYNSGMGRSCGTENTTATVPKDMGSNLVTKGGRRKTNKNKKGGNLVTALATRPYVGTNPATSAQIIGESWNGKPTNIHDNPRPEMHAWKTVSNGSVLTFPSPTAIKSDMTLIANPSPYPDVSKK